ncbi:MAG: hypothetical protein RBG13Loki_2747 [Promethearchaeota archaeon CR_4]|nr:MAG: hypothetical protein RBG13Loki_2747 [Candidatus Lokiarchaeota archaeon CR_4]
MASGTYAKTIVRVWYKNVPNSRQFRTLPIEFQKNAKWTVEFFAELMAGYIDDPPSAWNGVDAQELVVRLIPRKSIFDRVTSEGFCPIMVAFFEFLGEGIIEEAYAEELARSLRGKERELLQNAKNVLD